MTDIRKEVRRDVKADRINKLYFDWLTSLIFDDWYEKEHSWRKLFRLLYETEFVYILDMDSNRADDGIELRRQFAQECFRDEAFVLEVLDRKCSVLEMMVALALRCELHIIRDPDIGDQTGNLFFNMLASLGISEMDDEHFEMDEAVDILYAFMHREYQPSGRGSLFTICDQSIDMRKIEIWYQMMYYLNEQYYGKDD